MAEFSLSDTLAGLSKTDLGEVIEKGLYPMRCVEAEFVQSTKKGTPGYRYVGEIIEGEEKGEKLEGTAWVSKTKGGIQLFWTQLTALGVDGDWVMREKPSNPQIAESLVGAHFLGNVDIEEPQAGQQGRRRNRLIAQSPLDSEDGGSALPEPTRDEGGDVMVDDLFVSGESVAEPASEPAAKAPTAPAAEEEPGPDGSAGDKAAPLPPADDDDDDNPWK